MGRKKKGGGGNRRPGSMRAAVSKGSRKSGGSKASASSSSTAKQQAAAAVETKAEKLDKLFRKLHQHVLGDDGELVAQTADRILALDGEDQHAWKCKLVALIHANQFGKALEALEGAPEAVRAQMVLEHAYVLYRTKKHDECLALLEANVHDRTAPGLMDLNAQLLYRLRQYTEASRLYEEHFGHNQSEADDNKVQVDSEMHTNLLAAYVSSGRAAEVVKSYDDEMRNFNHAPSHEVGYNAACALLQAGRVQEAVEALDKAHALGSDTMQQEGWEPAEITDELNVIQAQRAYALALLGDKSRALALNNEVLNSKPSDASVVTTTCINIVALRKRDEKLQDSTKRIERAAKTSPEKLSNEQLQAIYQNEILLAFHNKQHDECRDKAGALKVKMPTSRFPVLVLAAVALKEGDFDAAARTLAKFIEANQLEGDTDLQLALAQVEVARGNWEEAARQLEAIDELRHQPATVATVVELYQRADQPDRASAALANAIAHWDPSKEGSKQIALTLLRRRAELNVEAGQLEDALDVYHQLAKLSDDAEESSEYMCRAVIAASRLDAAKCEELVSTLPPVPGLDAIDVDALEQQPLLLASSSSATVASKTKTSNNSNGDDDEKKQTDEKNTSSNNNKQAKPPIDEEALRERRRLRRKLRKKKRYPKNFDPENPGPMPDPERWLPKWQRSRYRKSRRRRKGQKTGAQGAANEKDADKYDMAKQIESGAVPTTPVMRKPPANVGKKRNRKRRR